MYSNCCCSCSFETETIKIGQSSNKMNSNNIVNFQESTTILNVCTKKVSKPIESTTYLIYMYEEDLALNNLQLLICHKTQLNQIKDMNIVCIRGYFNEVHEEPFLLASLYPQVSIKMVDS